MDLQWGPSPGHLSACHQACSRLQGPAALTAVEMLESIFICSRMTDDGNVYYIQGRTVFHTQDVILSFGIKTPEWQQQNQKYLQRRVLQDRITLSMVLYTSNSVVSILSVVWREQSPAIYPSSHLGILTSDPLWWMTWTITICLPGVSNNGQE